MAMKYDKKGRPYYKIVNIHNYGYQKNFKKKDGPFDWLIGCLFWVVIGLVVLTVFLEWLNEVTKPYQLKVMTFFKSYPIALYILAAILGVLILCRFYRRRKKDWYKNGIDKRENGRRQDEYHKHDSLMS